MTRAIYAGSFDPITWGHLDIIARAFPLFELVIGVANNVKKKPFLPIGVRRELVTKSLRFLEIEGRITDSYRIEVHEIRGLLAEFCAKNNIKVAIRGLRNTIDFEYEFGMAHINSGLGNIETIFIPAKGNHTHVSSSAVRELALYGADISQYVPPVVAEAIRKPSEGLDRR